MKKKWLAMLLAVVLAVGLLPGTAFAAQAAKPDLPDWYFLFAIFKSVDADCADKDGTVTHITYTMTRDEVEFAHDNAQTFVDYMNSLGVMNAYVDVVEIDATVTELKKSTASDVASGTNGSFLDSEQAAPFLKAKGIDLDDYDHVTCIVSLDASMGYLAITGSEFENGTGHACMNFKSREYLQRMGYLKMHKPSQDLTYLESAYAHELLHFMERLNKKWGKEFDLHGIWQNYYAGKETACYTDLILNQFTKDARYGTGVEPISWQYPPRALRITPIPEGVTVISDYAFWARSDLEKVTVPGSVTSIGYAAFCYCSGLKSVTISDGVTDIGGYAFYDCGSLTAIYIPASVTRIGEAAFWGAALTDVYYGGTQAQWNAIQMESYNTALTGANIHCSGAAAATPAFTDVPAGAWYEDAVAWAVKNGVTTGTGDGTTFSPNVICTHGEIITFLWRAAGEPRAAAQTAVTVDSWAQDAVNWAYETGIINAGFQASAHCTRADTVKYIWQARGSESAGASSFNDVAAGSDYYAAVNWAVENGVTEGTGGGAFSPGETCTRGEIVTFLRRAYVPEARLSA